MSSPDMLVSFVQAMSIMMSSGRVSSPRTGVMGEEWILYFVSLYSIQANALCNCLAVYCVRCEWNLHLNHAVDSMQ